MKTKRVLRYWCDHCNKSGGRKDAMIKHEKHCIKNPQRICRMCIANNSKQLSIDELVNILNDEGLDKLKEKTKNCPACILAAIVKSKRYDLSEKARWNFKEEVNKFWERKNNEEESLYSREY